MFIGHFALGMAGKRAAPKVSLPVLFLAAQFADMLWPVLVAAGIETVKIDPGNTKYTPLDFVNYPWSHSLLMLCIWGLVLGMVYRLNTGDRRGALVVGLLVVSHWVLDWITHRADMPLFPGSAKFGLALWNNPQVSIGLEVLMFAAGTAIYEGTTKGKDKKGQYAFWVMIVLLLVAFALGSGGPPPPSVQALWTTAIIAMLLGLALSAYVDRHRTLEDNMMRDSQPAP